MIMGPASMSVAVSRGNEMLFQRAYGMADIATKRPATEAGVYRIGVVSTQFTAALVLKAVDRGKLALTDSIGRHLTTGLRPEWRPLTIEQLLGHTAGLPNSFKRDARPHEVVSTATVIAWAARDTMSFAPGTQIRYSGVGYLLLGALVEKLYGKPYDAVLREEIARPLGLRTLGRCGEPGEDTLETTGYQDVAVDDRRPTAKVHPSQLLGAGGLCASAVDLAVWIRSLHGGRVLSPASYVAMITPRGEDAPFHGFALLVNDNPPWGVPTIWLVSSGSGFATESVWFPAQSLAVSVLYNSSGSPSSGVPFALDVVKAVSTPR
jgi:CubicO group peptidase (beta-lactamase class C family)